MCPKIQENLAEYHHWPLTNRQSIRQLYILCILLSGRRTNLRATKLQMCVCFKWYWSWTGLYISNLWHILGFCQAYKNPKMTSFGYFESILTFVLNRGRGNRCNYTTCNVLFTVLTVFRNDGSWYFVASMFKIQSVTSQRLVISYTEFAGNRAFKLLVENKRELFFILTHLIHTKSMFKNFL